MCYTVGVDDENERVGSYMTTTPRTNEALDTPVDTAPQNPNFTPDSFPMMEMGTVVDIDTLMHHADAKGDA